MIRHISIPVRRFWRAEAGQVLPIAAFMMVVLTAMVGLAVDVGNIYLAHRELQASTDAAALAGAAQIPTAVSSSTVYNAANNASSLSSGANGYKNLTNVSMASGYPVMKCLTTMQAQGISCVGPQPYNSIQVIQQATVPLYFARIVGKNSMTISASATAAKGGGSSRPYNIALVVDTTLSMNQFDSDCGYTQMQCTLQGIRQLLTLLDPCGTSQTSCNISAGNSQNSVVRVAIFTFPQEITSTTSNNTSCPGGQPYATAYGFPPAGATSYNPGTTSYRVVDFQSDYRLSDTATSLNPGSGLAIAMGGVNGCYGLQPASTNFDWYYFAGTYWTYSAGAIYAAQAALVNEQALYPNSQNVLIIVGDGDSNAPQINGFVTVMPSPANNTGLYPSYWGECGQAITAAAAATAQGTRVYSVAYGSPPTGCSTDQTGQGHAAGLFPNVLPCNEMAQLASAPYYFFSDFNQSGSNSNCVAPQKMVALSDIFLQIAGDLTVARIIPDSTT